MYLSIVTPGLWTPIKSLEYLYVHCQFHMRHQVMYLEYQKSSSIYSPSRTHTKQSSKLQWQEQVEHWMRKLGGGLLTPYVHMFNIYYTHFVQGLKPSDTEVSLLTVSLSN